MLGLELELVRRRWLNVSEVDFWRRNPNAVIYFLLLRTAHWDRKGGASLSPRLCRRTSRASSVANSVLGKRIKILVLGGQQ